MLQSTCEVLAAFIKRQLLDGLQTERDTKGRVELPAKSFGADGGGALSQASTSFAALQSGEGPLTTEFTLGSAVGRRMVTGYHAWRLQRINCVLKSCTETQEGRGAVQSSAPPHSSDLTHRILAQYIHQCLMQTLLFGQRHPQCLLNTRCDCGRCVLQCWKQLEEARCWNLRACSRDVGRW